MKHTINIIQHPFVYLKTKQQENRKRRFLEAAEKGDYKAVAKLLQKDVPVDIRNTLEKTALILATEQGHALIVELLLQQGADMNVRNTCGQTVLMIAIKKGYTDIAQTLLNYQASIHEQDDMQNTALMYAAYHGDKTIVRDLLKKGGDVNTQNKLNDTVLMHAARGGHQDIIQWLFDYGIQHVDTINIYRITALMYAVCNKHIEAAQCLIQNGAAINIKNTYGENALFWAIYNTDTPLVKLLLKNNADFHITTPFEDTLLHTLAYHISYHSINKATIACIKLLFLCNIDRYCKNEDNQTAEEITSQITRLATQADEYRDTLAQEYSFFKSAQINHHAIRDWILLTPREKALSKFLSDRNVYADLMIKFSKTDQPVLRKNTDENHNLLAKLPQEIIDRIRFFLFPPSISQHSFAGKINYITKNITLRPPHTMHHEKHATAKRICASKLQQTLKKVYAH